MPVIHYQLCLLVWCIYFRAWRNLESNCFLFISCVSQDRDGFVMGEGSGVLVLEELEHAKVSFMQFSLSPLSCWFRLILFKC
jgi:hypothetical protein